MSPDPQPPAAACEAVTARLSDAFFARTAAAESDRDHAAGCAACGSFQRDLVVLAGALATDATPTARDALVHQTLERARAELSRHEAATAALPAGYRREVGRLIGAALLPLPLVLLWNAAVLSVGGELLSGLLPTVLLQALAAGYVLAGATWLGCLYGSLPLMAHNQLRRRALEMA
jgi:hypothetical protein